MEQKARGGQAAAPDTGQTPADEPRSDLPPRGQTGKPAGPPSSRAPHPQRRPWSVPNMPQPSYAARERVGGRLVHPDTDIRGVPLVDGSLVPGRPVASEGAGRARSTDEVVASQPVAFDLEAVLDARRAE